MNRLTDNDRNLGPFTLARWKRVISLELETYGDEDDDHDERYNTIRAIAFGWALRVRIPALIQPFKEKKIAHSWDEETVKRMGRNWYYSVFPKTFGLSLSDMGNGYDFFQLHYGAQTHDSSTTKSWCTHLPWKQWRCVRHSAYTPEGKHFATEVKGKLFDFLKIKDTCPTAKFGFEDFDGEMIVATCVIEEMEWHRGEDWFKWLGYFWPAKIRRSLVLSFSAEVGPEKGSWKGGTTGHSINMIAGETPRMAFERYCAKEHNARHGRKFRLRFIGPVNDVATTR